MATRLNLRHERAIEMRLSGLSVTQMAAALDCSYGAVCNLLMTPYVRQRIAEAEAEALKPVLDKARAEVEGCLQVLRDILHDTGASNRDRINAANSIIKVFFDARDAVETQTRLAHLEGAIPSLTSPDPESDEQPSPLNQAS